MMPTLSPAPANRVDPRLPEATQSGVLLQRIRAEFLEMPGLTLTLSQAARLWSVRLPEAEALLAELVIRGFLACDSRGRYVRRGSPRYSR